MVCSGTLEEIPFRFLRVFSKERMLITLSLSVYFLRTTQQGMHGGSGTRLRALSNGQCKNKMSTCRLCLCRVPTWDVGTIISGVNGLTRGKSHRRYFENGTHFVFAVTALSREHLFGPVFFKTESEVATQSTF